MKQFLSAFGVLMLLFLTGCVEKLPVPNYLEVSEIGVEAIGGRPGTGSHNIKDVWLAVDGQQLGANSYPCIFPYETNDTLVRQVRVQPGIYNNGISNTRRIYPFLEPYDTTLTFVRGEVHEIKPLFRYRSDRKVIIIEDFENAGSELGEDLDGNTGSYLERQTDDVFEGQGSGRMLVTDSTLVCRVGGSASYRDLMPQSSSFPVYLELNYKCTLPFLIILRAHKIDGTIEERTLYGVNPAGYWNKIYFELTEEVAQMGAVAYSVAFETQYDASKPDGTVLLDNIQIVHF